MSTHCTIIVAVGPADYRAISCHYDGMASHMMPILRDFFNSPEGALSIVRGRVAYDALAFNRDGSIERNTLDGAEARRYSTLSEALEGEGMRDADEYVYNWDGFRWWVNKEGF